MFYLSFPVSKAVTLPLMEGEDLISKAAYLNCLDKLDPRVLWVAQSKNTHETC